MRVSRSATDFAPLNGTYVTDVKVLADWYRNEYIFRVSYEINPTDYEHLLPDIATFGTDNV